MCFCRYCFQKLLIRKYHFNFHLRLVSLMGFFPCCFLLLFFPCCFFFLAVFCCFFLVVCCCCFFLVCIVSEVHLLLSFVFFILDGWLCPFCFVFVFLPLIIVFFLVLYSVLVLFFSLIYFGFSIGFIHCNIGNCWVNFRRVFGRGTRYFYVNW